MKLRATRAGHARGNSAPAIPVSGNFLVAGAGNKLIAGSGNSLKAG